MLYSTSFTRRREASKSGRHVLPRVNDSRSLWPKSGIVSYIGLATYRALVEPYAEPRKEICTKPFYVKLTFRHILKGLMDDFE